MDQIQYDRGIVCLAQAFCTIYDGTEITIVNVGGRYELKFDEDENSTTITKDPIEFLNYITELAGYPPPESITNTMMFLVLKHIEKIMCPDKKQVRKEK